MSPQHQAHLAGMRGDDRLPRGAQEREVIKQRQERAWQFHTIRKLTVPEVARVLNVSERTVLRDLASSRRRNLAAFRKEASKADWLIANAMEALEEANAIMRQAWTDLVTAPAGSPVRAGFLNVLLKALGRRIEILQSLGLLDKAPEGILIGDLDLNRLSDDELAGTLADIRQRIDQARAPRGIDSGAAAEPRALDAGESGYQDEGQDGDPPAG